MLCLESFVFKKKNIRVFFTLEIKSDGNGNFENHHFQELGQTVVLFVSPQLLKPSELVFS